MRVVGPGLVLGVCGAAPWLLRVGPLAALGYVVACTWLYARLRPWARALSPSRARLWTFAALGALLVAWGLFYPLADAGHFGGGSDRDEALTLATQRLLAGQAPYAQPTYLGNPITPLPGALLVASPLVALVGSAAPLGLLALAAQAWLLSRLYDWRVSLLVCVAQAGLCAEGARDLLTGGDLLANGVLVCSASLCALDRRTHGSLWSWALLGVCLAWRVNFALGVPVLLVHAATSLGVGRALGRAAVMAAAALLPTLAVYLWDPSHFSPLHTFDELSFLTARLPHAALGLGLSAVVVGVASTWPQRQLGALRALWIVQAVWWVGALGLSFALGGGGGSLWQFGLVCVPFVAVEAGTELPARALTG